MAKCSQLQNVVCLDSYSFVEVRDLLTVGSHILTNVHFDPNDIITCKAGKRSIFLPGSSTPMSNDLSVVVLVNRAWRNSAGEVGGVSPVVGGGGVGGGLAAREESRLFRALEACLDARLWARFFGFTGMFTRYSFK